jgi:acetylornithine deacetylase
MLDPAIAAAIQKAVNDAFPRQVAFTQDLVRHPSVRGAEQTAQDFMARAYRARGLAVDRWTIDVDVIKDLPGFSPVKVSYENAVNVVGSYRPRSLGGRSLILNGHIDVVPTGPASRWTTGPYDPRVEGRWMYGRGAGDMKSGLAACLFAYDAVRAAGFRPLGDIHLQSVVEEECTGNGALACLQRGYRADCAIVPEPFEPKLMRAQLGPIWFRVTVEGDPQHASGFQSGGANAIEKAFAIWQRLKQLEHDWNHRKAEIPLYADFHHPIRFNLGIVKGGEWASSVPSSCTFEARAAVFPGWDLAWARGEIEAAVRDASEDDPYLSNHPPVVEFHGFMAEGYVLTDAGEPEQVLRDSHFSVFGERLQEIVTPAATDGRFFGLYQDTPALVYGPTCERAHGFDERVDLNSVRQVTKTIALFIAEWCGITTDEGMPA